MATSVPPIRPTLRRLVGLGALLLLPGCGGDDLLLPDDGAPAELRVVSGDEQRAPAGAPVGEPLVVQALDATGRPVSGAVVVFAFVDPPSGAAIAPPTPATGADGRASVEVTLGTPAGDQSVQARLDHPGGDLSVRFRLTALQPKGGGGDDGEGDGGSGGGGGGSVDDDSGGDDKGKGKDDDKDEGKDDKGKGKGKGKDHQDRGKGPGFDDD